MSLFIDLPPGSFFGSKKSLCLAHIEKIQPGRANQDGRERCTRAFKLKVSQHDETIIQTQREPPDNDFFGLLADITYRQQLLDLIEIISKTILLDRFLGVLNYFYGWTP